MFLAALLFFSTALLNVKPSPVFADVYIGAAGPYRFLVDTGSQTSVIDTALANQLHLKPEFRVELITQQSTQLVPGTTLSNIKVRDRVLPGTEIVFRDVSELKSLDPSVRGVLGANALNSFDFTLSPPTGGLEDTSFTMFLAALLFFPATLLNVKPS